MMMNLLKVHHLHNPLFSHNPKITPPHQPNFPPKFPSLSSSTLSLPLSLPNPCFKLSSVSKSEALLFNNEEQKTSECEDLAPESAVYLNTLRLVECSMFAAVTGLVYFLSNSLSIELTHGILGFTMGSLWRLGTNWGLSIFLCTIARTAGAMGYILTSSFLIRENILGLITINIHASLTFIFTATGINIIPSMNVIYAIFGTLVLLNSGFFVFLLHLLYSIFLARLGMKASLRLPGWLEKAL